MVFLLCGRKTSFRLEKVKSEVLTSLLLLFLLVNSMRLCDRIELFEREFLLCELLFVLSGVVRVTFSDTLCISYRDEFD